MIAAERVGRKPRPGVLRRVVEIGRFRDERSRDRATPPSHSDAANAKQTRSLIAINPTSGAAAGHTSSEMSPRARMSLPVSADFSPSLDTNAPLDRADRRPTSRRSTRPRRRVPARQQRQGLRSTCCPDLLVANSRARSTGRRCRAGRRPLAVPGAYAALAEQFLGPAAPRLAVLNCLTGFETHRTPYFSAAVASAINDWLRDEFLARDERLTLLWRFDKDWKGVWREVPWVKEPPSEYVRRHFRATTAPAHLPDDPAAADQLLEMLGGAGTLAYASDFPHEHGDGLSTLLGQHDDDGREGVLRQSAAALYGL